MTHLLSRNPSAYDVSQTTVGREIGAIAETLAFDPLETEILALALHYRLDQQVEKLVGSLSESRGGPTRFRRDAALIALLLNASTADGSSRLAPDARLLASGLLRLERDGDLGVLGRLTSVLRRDIQPTADLYDQLLGTMTAAPLPWDAFTHLGREAEVAASVLCAALARQED